MKCHLRNLMLVALVTWAFSLSMGAQAAKRTSGPKIIIKELQLDGISTLDTTEVNDIRNSLLELRMNDDCKELEERVRHALQERGYFDAEVTSVNIKALDPLATPKPVRAEAVVSEGPRFVLEDLKLTGARAFTADQLRESFPHTVGEFMTRSKVGAGLEKLRQLYTASGYLDMFAVPEVTKSGDARLSLAINIHEGKQYHFKELKTYGDPDLGGRLSSRWQMEPGAVFDATYLDRFLEENSSLLPFEFNRSRDMNFAQDCREAVVTVELNLDQKKPFNPTESVTNCEQKREGGKTN